MNDKRKKMWGEPVGREEVLRELGDPAEWAELSRKLDFKDRLRKGKDDLDISGIRGYGRIEGYLSLLEKALANPPGVGTSLVSEEENERIRRKVTEETEREIAKYRARLAELERSPQEIAEYVATMKWWLGYLAALEPQDPEIEDLDELKELARKSNDDREKEVAQLQSDIETYERLLQTLQA